VPVQDLVLVTGASGCVGRELVTLIASTQTRVRAITRGSLPTTPEVEWEHGDLRSDTQVRHALRDVEVAYYLVHSVGQSVSYGDLELEMARRFRDAAAAAGVRKIIYLGGVVPEGQTSTHLRSRLAVGECLRAGPVPCLELRASMIVAPRSASFRVLRDIALRLPLVPLPHWSHARTMPIALDDVTMALLCALDLPLEQSCWYELPGCEALSVAQMLAAVHRLRGRRVPTFELPLLDPPLVARGLRLLTAVPHSLILELLNGYSKDLLPCGPSFWDAIGLFPQISFESAVLQALLDEPFHLSLRSAGALLSEGVVQALGSALKRWA
jgi:uncharacterized protein YbjT (DUF2867 family)